MRKHSFLRGLTAFTLAGLLAFYSGVVQLPNVSAESITDLKSQLAELEKQEEENNKRLEELRDDVSQKRAYRDELQGKIDIIQQQLDILVQRINELDAQIEQGEQDIADTRISINANYTKLKKRLRALYMAGEASNLSILLSSTSLVDYTQKSEVIQSVTKHDTELLDTLEEQLTSIQEQVEKINADKEELSTDKKDLDSKSDELSALYLENQKLLDEAEQNEAEAQAEAERLEKEKKRPMRPLIMVRRLLRRAESRKHELRRLLRQRCRVYRHGQLCVADAGLHLHHLLLRRRRPPRHRHCGRRHLR